jgi:hypothetical protein
VRRPQQRHKNKILFKGIRNRQRKQTRQLQRQPNQNSQLFPAAQAIVTVGLIKVIKQI